MQAAWCTAHEKLTVRIKAVNSIAHLLAGLDHGRKVLRVAHPGVAVLDHHLRQRSLLFVPARPVRGVVQFSKCTASNVQKCAMRDGSAFTKGDGRTSLMCAD